MGEVCGLMFLDFCTYSIFFVIQLLIRNLISQFFAVKARFDIISGLVDDTP